MSATGGCRWCAEEGREPIISGLSLVHEPLGWFLSLDGTMAAARFCPWCGRYLDPTVMPAPDDSSTLKKVSLNDAVPLLEASSQSK